MPRDMRVRCDSVGIQFERSTSNTRPHPDAERAKRAYVGIELVHIQLSSPADLGDTFGWRTLCVHRRGRKSARTSGGHVVRCGALHYALCACAKRIRYLSRWFFSADTHTHIQLTVITVCNIFLASGKQSMLRLKCVRIAPVRTGIVAVCFGA